jgi:hypothetical protein
MLKVFRFFRQLQSAVWVQIQRARVGTGNIRRDGIPEGFFIFCLFREMPEKTDVSLASSNAIVLGGDERIWREETQTRDRLKSWQKCFKIRCYFW